MLKESPVIRLKSLIDNEIWEFRDNLMGQILTIIDASISDQEQRKGLKDLIKRTGYDHEHMKWFLYRIGKIILEFNSKFAKVKLEDEDKKYLETGERTYSQGMEISSPEHEYFTEIN